MTALSPIRADHRWQEECIRYSICTIITRRSEYSEMVDSFKSGGFHEPDCEFLYLDNTLGNAFDAYAGNNLFMNVARGQFIILCHQDVLLIEDGRTELDTLISNLTELDPNWAVCGNAGKDLSGRLVLHITDPHGTDRKVGKLPAQVISLDENFIVVRRAANLALSHDLEGFHLHGADICIMADFLGYGCYVIDFHLQHKSTGLTDKAFFEARDQLIRKYRRALRSRWITTTCTSLFISGSPLLARLLNGIAATAQFVKEKAIRISQIALPFK
jgi:hypothetical protein